jgi:uncharacterized membrane protein YkgB
MACSVSCSISLIFIIGMIYFYNATSKSEVVKQYKTRLPKDLQIRYENISRERMMISYYGYGLGVLLSLVIIFYNKKMKGKLLSNASLVCIVLSVSFFTNYFYYMLSPKTDWMLNHVKNPEETKAWLQMYREMQFNYHLGLVLGIIAVGVLAFAFRC